jgi:MFS family permease
MMIRRRWFLTAIALGMLLNPLGSSVISVAMARLQVTYHLNFTSVSWIISSFYISSAIAQPTMGKVADLFGHRKMFLSGLVVVAIASLLAPFSPNFTWLIVFRILQSMGSSAISPTGMALVRNHISEGQAKALAILAVFSSTSAAFGPAAGGFLIHWWDWPAIFYINLPFIVASFLMSLWVLPRDVSSSSTSDYSTSVSRLIKLLDIPGMALFAIALVGISLAFLSTSSVYEDIFGVIGFVALLVFIWHELSTANPFIPLRIFAQNPDLTWLNLQFFIINVIFYSIFFGVPTYLQDVRHLGEQETGLLMLSLAGFSLIFVPIAGRWVHKRGSRPPLVLSGALLILGTVAILTIQQSSPLGFACLALVPLGMANGLNGVALQSALFQSSPKDIIGTASGLFMMSRFLGTIIASILLGLVFGPVLTNGGFRRLGGILAVFAIMALVMSLRLSGNKQKHNSVPSET